MFAKRGLLWQFPWRQAGEVSESAEGARLLSAYTVLSCIEGSNPSLSARMFFLDVLRWLKIQ